MTDSKAWFEQGKDYERERIIALLEERASEWLSHDGVDCICLNLGLELKEAIALIKGENK